MIKNLIFRAYLLISDFLAKSVKANKNQQKRSLILQCSFAKKPHSFYKPQINLTLQKLHSCNTAKNLTYFTNFTTDIVLIGVRKNICTAPSLEAQELHSLGKQIFVYSCISP